MTTYAEETLGPNEKFLRVNRLSAWPSFGWLVLITFAFTIWFLLIVGDGQNEGIGLGMGVLFWTILLLISMPFFGVYVFVMKKTSELSLTSRRVVSKWGIVFRKTNELLLDRIEGVQVDQSVFGRLLGYGTLTFSGVGTTLLRVKWVQQPMDFRRSYMEIKEAARGERA